MRIAKFLARAGVCSRRDAEKLLLTKKVKINNKVITSPVNFVTNEDEVTYEGNKLSFAKTRLFIMHKPTGYVVTNKDEKNRPTIFDLIPKDLPRLVSIGRLDLNSEGLILLTNDGEFAREFELPKNNYERVYKIRVFGKPNHADFEKLKKGIKVDGIQYGPVQCKIIKTGNNSWIEVSLREGKNREIRKLFSHLGYDVNRLIRTSYGKYNLADLEKGKIKEAILTNSNS